MSKAKWLAVRKPSTGEIIATPAQSDCPCTGLPYNKLLSFTHHTFTDLLSTPSKLSKTFQRLESILSASLVPRPSVNAARGKGGLVNIVQHFCRSGGISVWDDCQISQSGCTRNSWRYRIFVLYSPDPPFLWEC